MSDKLNTDQNGMLIKSITYPKRKRSSKFENAPMSITVKQITCALFLATYSRASRLISTSMTIATMLMITTFDG